MQQKGNGAISDLTSISNLEDEIYLQMDKLIALCAAQTALDDNDHPLPLGMGIRSHYSLLMEEQARAVRKLLDKALEPANAPGQPQSGML